MKTIADTMRERGESWALSGPDAELHTSRIRRVLNDCVALRDDARHAIHHDPESGLVDICQRAVNIGHSATGALGSLGRIEYELLGPELDGVRLGRAVTYPETGAQRHAAALARVAREMGFGG